VDRLVAFCALIAFAKIQQSNRGLVRRVEAVKQNLDKSKKFSKLNYSPFRHIGASTISRHGGMTAPKRNAFKNFR
jgi:hypothetical protein